jgi:hypothetical protein
MISSTTFWVFTTGIIVLIVCYIIFLVKFKSAEESSEFSSLPELFLETSDDLLLETSENLPTKRRRELLERIKEERIKEYLDHKKRK